MPRWTTSHEAAMLRHARAIACAALLLGPAPAMAATFGFDALAPTNAGTPLSETVAGLTATFTSPSGAGAFIAEDGSAFSTLGSSVLANDNFTPEELDVAFSAPLSAIALPFATNDAGAPTGVTLTALLNGIPVGSVTRAGTVAASGLPEGALNLAGSFNSVRITDTGVGNAGFAIGAVTVTAVPEPAALPMLASGLLALAALRRRRR